MSDEFLTELVMRWTSHQQTNWVITINVENARWESITAQAHDGAREQALRISTDQSILCIESDTSWDTASCVVLMNAKSDAVIHVGLRDPYVEDRQVDVSFSLDDLKRGQRVNMDSIEWPVKECYFSVSTLAEDIEGEKTVLVHLGNDRRKNIEALIALANETRNPRRLELILRAAAACTGACNHGPLEPDGWDWAISLYRRVVEENPNTDAARDAQWAMAACYACWSPEAGCDRDGRGKGQWFKALDAYQELYRISESPSDKANALRRMAEIQCYEIGEIDEGLENYLKIALEFPEPLPISLRWVYRTCAPHEGCDNLAWDMFRALIYRSNDPEQALRIYERVFGKVEGNQHVAELRGYMSDAIRSTE